jgi:molybdate transport system substrate-binding protein
MSIKDLTVVNERERRSADIVGISSMATRQILAELGGSFRQQTGQSVAIESVGGVDVVRRVHAGETFDIIVLADNVMKELEAAGFLKPESRVGFAESGIAVAVRSGAILPSLADEAAVKAAVIAAQSICYSTGPSGAHLIKLLEKWGFGQLLAGRLVKAPPGVAVGSLVARGDAELGFQQLSELLDVPGIEIAGNLPQAIQSVTRFSCGVGARTSNEAGARDLIGYLTSAHADSSKRRLGMRPARPQP